MGKIKLQKFLLELDSYDVSVQFHSGDIISGKCVIQLNGELHSGQLDIRLKGLSSVYWTEDTGTGDDKRTDTYSSEHIILDVPYHCVVPNLITRGEHHIPFAFQLPQTGLWSSFEGSYGNIRYWISAEIHKPEAFKSNHRTKVSFMVDAPTFAPIAELSTHVSGSNSKEIGFFNFLSKAKVVELYANINRMGHCIGESIAVNCTVKNPSKKSIVPRVTLKQFITFTANRNKKNEHKNIIRTFGTEIGPKQSISESLLLNIPANLSIAQFKCPNIEVSYSITVTLVIPGSFDLHLNLPVIITNQPFVEN